MSEGYANSQYAAALSEFGEPRWLARSGGWLLEREIAGTSYRDAMGCYPLFACEDWAGLEADLNELHDLVSVALVADPFGNHDPELLRRCFPDRLIPFKEHLVTDLSLSPESFVDAQHRRKARRALARLEVKRCDDATPFVDDWNKLYANLIRRHDIRGLAAFSAHSFEKQMAVPGLEMFRASDGDETLGMTLWYVDRGVAYYHLGAYSDAGYARESSFAIFWYALDHFARRGVQWLDLGAGAGVSGDDKADGLTRFKRGWANTTRIAYFCGRIIDRARYDEAVQIRNAGATDYFPAYRKGEFG